MQSQNNKNKIESSENRDTSMLKCLFIHQSIEKKVKELESQLPILLSCYPEATFVYDKMGRLPLHIACMYHSDNIKIIRPIISSNPAAVLQKMKKTKNKGKKFPGRYPIHIALACGVSLEVLKFLINDDREILHLLDKNGRSMLQLALQYGAKPSIFYFLLTMDEALIFLPDQRLNLPLHIACRYGCDEDIMETLLLRAPQALHAKNRDGQSPLEIAYCFERCSEEVINLICNSSTEEHID